MRQFVIALILAILALSLASWLCPRTPMIWNRIETKDVVMVSAVGPNLTNYYSTKSNAAGRFGLCHYIPSGAASGESIAVESHVIPFEGMIDLWIKPDGWSVVNDTVSYPGGVVILMYSLIGAAWTGLSAQGGIMWELFDGTASHTMTVTTGTLVQDEWNHIQLAWSQSGNWTRMWINGVLKGELSSDVNFSEGTAWALYLGKWEANGSYQLDGYIDNFKEWSYHYTNMLDYKAERRGMNDSVQ